MIHYSRWTRKEKMRHPPVFSRVDEEAEGLLYNSKIDDRGSFLFSDSRHQHDLPSSCVEKGKVSRRGFDKGKVTAVLNFLTKHTNTFLTYSNLPVPSVSLLWLVLKCVSGKIPSSLHQPSNHPQLIPAHHTTSSLWPYFYILKHLTPVATKVSEPCHWYL